MAYDQYSSIWVSGVPEVQAPVHPHLRIGPNPDPRWASIDCPFGPQAMASFGPPSQNLIPDENGVRAWVGRRAIPLRCGHLICMLWCSLIYPAPGVWSSIPHWASLRPNHFLRTCKPPVSCLYRHPFLRVSQSSRQHALLLHILGRVSELGPYSYDYLYPCWYRP